MRSPFIAMLWEQWHLTRVELAFRIGTMYVGGAALAALDKPAASLFFSAYVMSLLLLSIVKLNGGRFMDGYHPGFPLHLLYTRPVNTSEFVGISMGFTAAAGAALYLAWAVPMRAIFDYPFPLLPGACLMAVFQLVQAAGYWATRSKTVQWAGSLVGYMLCMSIALWRGFQPVPEGSELTPFHPELWAEIFSWSLAEYALLLAISVLSIVVTIAGVSRQRRGDARAARPRESAPTQSTNWLAQLFAIPCPTSSPLKAQIWFDLRSSGLLVLNYALIVALAIPLLYTLSSAVELMRPLAFMLSSLSLVAIVWLSGNAFGIRSKQGKSYAGSFESMQSFNTARLACLKILVRAGCLVAGLLLVLASNFLSLSIGRAWGENTQELIRVRDNALSLYLDLPLAQQASLVLVFIGSVALVVSLRAALSAVMARYPHQLYSLSGFVILWGTVFVLRNLAVPDSNAFAVLDWLCSAFTWLSLTLIVLGTIMLYRRTLAENLLTAGTLGLIAVATALFASAWVTVLQLNGIEFGTLPATTAAQYLSPAALPLVAGVLALWSLSRVRHT